MPIKIEMPRLSDTMEEGTLLTWNVKVGDEVSSGDHMADVETDKATMELQTFDDGKVAKLVVEEGQTVAVGDVIAVLAEPGESIDDAAAAELGSSGGDSAQAPAEAKGDAEEEKTTADKTDAPASTSGSSGRLKVSPLARKLAEEHGLDITQIQGSGPDGRIIKRDVLEAAQGGSGGGGEGGNDTSSAPSASSTSSKPAASPPPPPAMPTTTLESKTIAVSGMRKTIAKRLVESKTTVPHFQVSVAVKMDALIQLRGTINKQLEAQGVKLSVNDFVTRGVALAAAQHPPLNSSWTGDAIQQHGSVNVGTAIALPAERGGGLVVAVVRDVQNKGLRQISEEIKSLAGKARGKGLSPEEMSDSTITISNLGMPQYGVTQFTAIVNPPNAAIIAVGAALEQPVVVDGEITIGHVMNVTLSGDHRVIDGAQAAEYLATLRSMLENPAALLV